jgi:hypothetical protein
LKKILLFLAAALLLFGCISPPPPEPSSFEVFFSRGSGWVGWNANLSVTDTGHYIYQEKFGRLSSNKTSVYREGTLSENDTAEIKRLMGAVDIGSYNERYFCSINCPTDLPSESITFKVGGVQAKTVSMYEPQSMPESLSKIVGKMRSIAYGISYANSSS